MRRAIALALLFLVPSSMGAAATVTFHASNEPVSFVDIIDHAGDTIEFRAPESAWTSPPVGALLRLSCSCSEDVLEYDMSKSSSSWVTFVSVNEKKLVVGSWDARVEGIYSTGSPKPLAPATLSVAADDPDAPAITFPDIDANTNTVHVGLGESVVIRVQDTTLQYVKYQIDGMPRPIALGFPYSLSVETFEVGEQELRVEATDRAGHKTVKTIKVYADDIDPVVSIDAPPRLYDGVPNPIHLQVTEDSSFTVTARVGGETSVRTFEGSADQQNLTVTVTPQGLGGTNLIVDVRDDLGNEVRQTFARNVTTLEADVRLVGASFTGGPVIPGEPLQLNVEARLGTSPVPVEAAVFYGSLRIGEFMIEPTGQTNATFDALLPPGQHSRAVLLVTDEAVVELEPDNQSLDVGAEVFNGRVKYGEATFHIRPDELGRPIDAIGEDGTRYSLSLRDDGLGVRYEFEVDGETLYWSPQTLTTVVPVEKEDVKGDRGIPGPSVVVLLAAIALLARRRD